ncbi:MAG: carboxylating nicotinate-nucleotide diphosphorylase [bacterium]
MRKLIKKLQIRKILKNALKEDIGAKDITTCLTVPKEAVVKGYILAKEKGVIAGIDMAEKVFKLVDRRIKFVAKIKDGTRVKKEKVLVAFRGPARGIMAGERVALNFLQQLSGIATLTNQFVKSVKGSKVKILDTRKTTPGLRLLEKYAVKVGGGTNHRLGLYDAILIKDNHIAIAGGIVKAIKKAKAQEKPIEVEAKTLLQVREAIRLGVDRILLDNMTIKTLSAAVKLCKNVGVKTEASGGVNLENVKKIAETGVDYISVGALTHSARALDISLLVL